jgi:uncharacterized protein YkwD
VIGVRSCTRRTGPAAVLVVAIICLVFAEPLAPGGGLSTRSVVHASPAVSGLRIDAISSTVTRYAASASAPVRTMRSLINGTRSLHRLIGLRLNDRLNTVARRHSARMASSDNLHHNPRLAKELASMSWRIIGENVGVGATVQTLHKAFMNSPSHRSNVLGRRYRLVGIGVVLSGGRTWVTVVFYG